MVGYDDFRVHLDNRSVQSVKIAKGRGAIATVSQQASELGIKVLKDGGNAFDAAFAVAFALTIYHPQAGNIGGGGYVIYKEKGAKTPSCINYREKSPAAVKREGFLDEKGNVDPELTALGPKSVCIPGTVKAFFTLQKAHGALTARDILTHLARLSHEGCRITRYQAECINRLNEKLCRSPESKKIYGQKGRAFSAGDLLPNPDLGETFLMLAREGEKAFYEGKIAEGIEDDLSRNGGYITTRDLKNYSIKMVEPVSAFIDGTSVWSVPPEGGGAFLIEILNILNREQFHKIDPLSPDFYHYLAQAFKMASVDRLFYLGDVPLEGNRVYHSLFKREWADTLFSLIDRESDIKTEKILSLMHPEEGDVIESGEQRQGSETTHFSIIDGEGNALSNSYTLNLRYGAKWSVKDMGFLLNGSMDAFSFSPGRPNYFGVIGNRPNLLAPNKRPASNMAPVLVTKGKEVVAALGTPGGPAIPTSLAQALFLILSHKMEPQAALQLGRIHHQGWPDVFYKEEGSLSENTILVLVKKGYTIQNRSEPIGDFHAVFTSGSEILAVSDYRREGSPSAL